MAPSPRDHVRATVAVVLGLATLLGAVAVLVPSIRDTMKESGIAGWVTALTFFALWLAALIVSDARSHDDREQIGRLEGELADGKTALADQERRLRKSHMAQLNDLVETRDAEINDLRTRNDPTRRDLDQFRELMGLLPYGRGAMGWLEYRFNAKQWTSEDFEALAEIQGDWRYRYFDDAETQASWERLLSGVENLTHWMAVNASPDNDLNKYQSADSPTIYTVADGDERHGGWAAFDKLRDVGSRLAGEVFDARREFERIGRQRGL